VAFLLSVRTPTLKVGGGGGQSGGNQHPQKTIPSPESHEKLGLHGNPQKATAKFHGSKSCRNNTLGCSDNGVVLAQGAGGYRQRNDKNGSLRRKNHSQPSATCAMQSQMTITPVWSGTSSGTQSMRSMANMSPPSQHWTPYMQHAINCSCASNIFHALATLGNTPDGEMTGK